MLKKLKSIINIILNEDDIEEKGDKNLEIEILATVSAQTLDTAHNIYSSIWDRIGNMQQSASTVFTIVSILVAILFSIIGWKDFDWIFFQKNKELLTPFFFWSIFLNTSVYIVLCLFFLLKILWPKQGLVLKNPLELEQLSADSVKESVQENQDFFTAIYSANLILINELDEIAKNAAKILNKNQRNYHRALLFICGIIFNILFILLIAIVEFPNFEHYIFLILSVLYTEISLVFILYILFTGEKYESGIYG